jgi:hypothetical protein
LSNPGRLRCVAGAGRSPIVSLKWKNLRLLSLSKIEFAYYALARLFVIGSYWRSARSTRVQYTTSHCLQSLRTTFDKGDKREELILAPSPKVRRAQRFIFGPPSAFASAAGQCSVREATPRKLATSRRSPQQRRGRIETLSP